VTVTSRLNVLVEKTDKPYIPSRTRENVVVVFLWKKNVACACIDRRALHASRVPIAAFIVCGGGGLWNVATRWPRDDRSAQAEAMFEGAERSNAGWMDGWTCGLIFQFVVY